jgi:hypothetical protein
MVGGSTLAWEDGLPVALAAGDMLAGFAVAMHDDEAAG